MTTIDACQWEPGCLDNPTRYHVQGPKGSSHYMWICDEHYVTIPREYKVTKALGVAAQPIVAQPSYTIPPPVQLPELRGGPGLSHELRELLTQGAGRSAHEELKARVQAEIAADTLRLEATAVLAPASEAARRKGQPLARGVLDYFPDALLAVAEVSRIGNEQHSPGQPIHWAKEKSTDEADALLRHLIDRGTLDTDGARHTAKVAWRALALLQRELDAEKE